MHLIHPKLSYTEKTENQDERENQLTDLERKASRAARNSYSESVFRLGIWI